MQTPPRAQGLALRMNETRGLRICRSRSRQRRQRMRNAKRQCKASAVSATPYSPSPEKKICPSSHRGAASGSSGPFFGASYFPFLSLAAFLLLVTGRRLRRFTLGMKSTFLATTAEHPSLDASECLGGGRRGTGHRGSIPYRAGTRYPDPVETQRNPPPPNEFSDRQCRSLKAIDIASRFFLDARKPVVPNWPFPAPHSSCNNEQLGESNR